jgi:uncharacterized membrane protein
MQKNRLEAFSDGVIAVIITIMVLEMHVPQGTSFAALKPLLPVFLSYVLSFVNVGIYWNNHHHLLHTVTRVDGPIMWANLHFLFWQSLIPFTTGWMGENHFDTLPTALYGFVLLMSGVAFLLLQLAIIRNQGKGSLLAGALGRDRKGKASLLLYASAIGLSFVNAQIAEAIYLLVALIWLIPDRRIERALKGRDE